MTSGADAQRAPGRRRVCTRSSMSSVTVRSALPPSSASNCAPLRATVRTEPNAARKTASLVPPALTIAAGAVRPPSMSASRRSPPAAIACSSARPAASQRATATLESLRCAVEKATWRIRSSVGVTPPTAMSKLPPRKSSTSAAHVVGTKRSSALSSLASPRARSTSLPTAAPPTSTRTARSRAGCRRAARPSARRRRAPTRAAARRIATGNCSRVRAARGPG